MAERLSIWSHLLHIKCVFTDFLIWFFEHANLIHIKYWSFDLWWKLPRYFNCRAKKIENIYVPHILGWPISWYGLDNCRSTLSGGKNDQNVTIRGFVVYTIMGQLICFCLTSSQSVKEIYLTSNFDVKLWSALT